MKKLLIILFAVTLSGSVYAQKVGVKTNLLYDATLTANLGFEFKLGKTMTLDVSGGWNQWALKDCQQWMHWAVQPELRWWTCEAFNGFFIGVHAMGGVYNFSGIKLPFDIAPGLADHRYEGHFIGGGITFGHQWILGPHWSLEAAIGVGYARIQYDKYECMECAPLMESGWENYFGPTKLALSVMYMF